MNGVKDTKDVICMVIDDGSLIETARRLAKDYKKVYYCIPGCTNITQNPNLGMVGEGIPEIEAVEDFWPYYQDIDLWFFPEIHSGAMQVELEEQDKIVWGSRKAEKFEIYRDQLKGKMEELGLPVNPWRMIRGLTKLRGYLKEHDNKWVKINKWRDLNETFEAVNYEEIEPVLDKLNYKLGRALREDIDFIVEDSLPDCVEIGEDSFCIDGKFPSQHMAGVEMKDRAYVAIFKKSDELPPAVTDFGRAFSKTFRSYGYRGFYSTESRMNKKKQSFMIDFTARAGSPPNELFQLMYGNFGKMIWAGANGDLVDPIPVKKFGAQLIMVSDWSAYEIQQIIIPERLRENVKLKYNVFKNNKHYLLPQSRHYSECGSVVALGDTMDEAIENVKSIAEKIDGYGVKIETSEFDNATKVIEKMEEFGVNYFKEEKEKKE